MNILSYYLLFNLLFDTGLFFYQKKKKNSYAPLDVFFFLFNKEIIIYIFLKRTLHEKQLF